MTELIDLKILKLINEKFTKFGFEADYIVEDSELIDFAKAVLKMAPLRNAVRIIQELRFDADMNYKEYENTYADGWDDAFNEVISALEKAQET